MTYKQSKMTRVKLI